MPKQYSHKFSLSPSINKFFLNKCLKEIQKTAKRRQFSTDGIMIFS